MYWKHFSDVEATWEDLDTLIATYPNLDLEDKVSFGEGSIVTARDGDHLQETTKFGPLNPEVFVLGTNDIHMEMSRRP